MLTSDTYNQLRNNGARLMKMQTNALDKAGIAHKVIGDETLFDVLFTASPVRNYRNVQNANSAVNLHYNEVLRKQGIFKSPGKMYPCLALTENNFHQTQQAIETAVLALD